MPVVGSTAFATAGDCMELVRALLNDADIPSVSTIMPTGAVRASNQVTLTTAADHGLQIGDVIRVLNVNDASFGGDFTVDTIPTTKSVTYAQFDADANSGNGTVSLIVQGDVYTDAVLLPLVNKSYRKVQQRLLQAGSMSSTGQLETTLPAGTVSLTDATSPQLPVDFLAPMEMYERITGNQFYGPQMATVDVLPSRPQQPYNYCFSWRDEGIFLTGALNDTDILLRYFKGTLYQLTDTQSQILIRGALDPIADWAAFLAANSRGAANAAIFSSLFAEDMHEFLNMQAHARQFKNGVGRRLNYNRRTSRGSQW